MTSNYFKSDGNLCLIFMVVTNVKESGGRNVHQTRLILLNGGERQKCCNFPFRQIIGIMQSGSRNMLIDEMINLGYCHIVISECRIIICSALRWC
jgi:hypothetical protein